VGGGAGAEASAGRCSGGEKPRARGAQMRDGRAEWNNRTAEVEGRERSEAHERQTDGGGRKRGRAEQSNRHDRISQS